MESKLTPASRTGGLLLTAFRENKVDDIRWVDVKVGDLVITVASDALKTTVLGRQGVRMPVSYRETIEICRDLECVAPTQAIADAIFAQATSQLNFVPLVRTAADSAKMPTVEFALKFHDGVEKQIAAANQADKGLVGGAWKYWLLHARLVERGAVNYGFWDKSKKPAKPVQSPGAQHDPDHYDYSQLLQPVKRFAKNATTGAQVDLLEYIATNDKVSTRFLAPYRKEQATVTSFAGPEMEAAVSLDLAALLTSAGVNVSPVDGWEKRGRTGHSPEGIIVHHTAGAKSGDAPSLKTCIDGRPDLSGPLCHILLSRSGKAYLISKNIANHAGKGAAQVLDLIRHDRAVTGNARDHGWTDAAPGNQSFYGIEVENSGQSSDPYPEAQIEALARICAALCQAHRWSANRVVHHRQWTSRKVDMSWRGDLATMIAQYMDTSVTSFSIGEDTTEPMWEPESENSEMHGCGADDADDA